MDLSSFSPVLSDVDDEDVSLSFHSSSHVPSPRAGLNAILFGDRAPSSVASSAPQLHHAEGSTRDTSVATIDTAVAEVKNIDCRLRKWCFTCFDDDDNLERLLTCITCAPGGQVKYCCFQVERCPTSDRPHAQGYIETRDALRLLTTKKLFNDTFARTVHLSKARKCRLAQIRYCTKLKNDDGTCARVDGIEPFIFDDESAEEGTKPKRVKLFDEIVTLLHDRKRIREIEFDDEYEHLRSTVTRNRRVLVAAEMAIWERHKSITRHVYVEVIYGDPGIGKSHSIHERWKDNFHDKVFRYTMGMGDWFDGYKGQKVLFIDDFNGWITAGKMLQYTDKYQLNVQVKGGFVAAEWEHVVIVGNIEPQAWWDFKHLNSLGLQCECKPYQMASLLSRICKVTHMVGTDQRPEHRAEPYPPDDDAAAV